jgi:hypothetical protein
VYAASSASTTSGTTTTSTSTAPVATTTTQTCSGKYYTRPWQPPGVRQRDAAPSPRRQISGPARRATPR